MRDHGRRRVLRCAWALPMVLVALSGCASSDDPGPQDDGQVRETIVDDDTETQVGSGRVSGVVLHPAGFPLADARVTILSVDHSQATAADGSFVFDEVPAGEQLMRVEKANYQTLNRKITVVEAKLTQVEVVLAPPSGTEGGFAEHVHDHWRGASTYAVFDDTVAFNSDTEELPPELCAGKYGAHCYLLPLFPEPGRIVPPGTAKITVDIAFEPGAVFDRERMTFSMYGPPDGEGKSAYMYETIDSATETFELVLASPGMADHGHAHWTDWSMALYWYPAQSYAAGAHYNSLFRGPVDVTITAHNGGVVLDPPHPRYWQDTDRIELAGSNPSSVFCSQVGTNCMARTPNPSVYSWDGDAWCYSGCVAPVAPVPQGTTRLQFSIEQYWGGNPQAPMAAGFFEQPDWVFGYKTAADPARNATWDHYKWLEPVETRAGDRGTVYSFELDVAEGEQDPYYTRVTSWIIMAGVRGQESADTWSMPCGTETCGAAYFELLDIVAINDDRDEMLAGDG